MRRSVLKGLLSSLDKINPAETGTCSLTFSGISSLCCTANVMTSNSFPWIVDSRATDHMTSSSKYFSSYTPCLSHRKITIADGSFTIVAGYGDVRLNSLCLKNVLHVRKLFANLISIQKVTQDFNCRVIFLPSYCIFQEQETKKMIGLAKVRNGLYYLENLNLKNEALNSLPRSFISESVMSSEERIWLYHRRLGHPSFQIVKIMFPLLFKGLTVESFHCNDCELAKHRRVSFSVSNKRSMFPFDLIHSDIWGHLQFKHFWC